MTSGSIVSKARFWLVTGMLDCLEFGTFGVFVGGNEKIGTLGPAHSDRIILTALAAAYFAVDLAFNSAAFGMCRRKDRLFDYLMSFGGVIFVVKFGAGNNIVGARLIERCSGAINKEIIVIAVAGAVAGKLITEYFGILKFFGVALKTNQHVITAHQFASAVDAFLFELGGIFI